jgi:hypothetical protein
MCRYKLFLVIFFLNISHTWGWGFAAHKQINRYAVFTLPPAMFTFYKYHLAYITENAVNPDKRRYIMEGEAARHYIDLDYYEDTTFYETASYWQQALKAYPQDTLLGHGIVPWHIYRMKGALTAAFKQKDLVKILKLSTELGHYLADANVPLHTTQNYNGQFSGQEGIHALWETRIPALFIEDYDFWVGKASYLPDSQESAWKAILQAHAAVDSVLTLEKQLTDNFPALKKYSFEQQGGILTKVYAKSYVQAYHTLLDGQVERQMRASIKLIGDFWLTCWIDADKPNLDELLVFPLEESQLQEEFSNEPQIKVRECGD